MARKNQPYLPFPDLAIYLARATPEQLRARHIERPRLRVVPGGQADPDPSRWIQLAIDTSPRPRGRRVPAGRRLPMIASNPECGYAEPCPYLTCTMHLAINVNPETGEIEMNHPISIDGRVRRLTWKPGQPYTRFRKLEAAILRQLPKLPHTCTLAVARSARDKFEYSGRLLSLAQVGAALGYTGEWASTTEARMLEKLRIALDVDMDGVLGEPGNGIMDALMRAFG